MSSFLLGVFFSFSSLSALAKSNQKKRRNSIHRFVIVITNKRLNITISDERNNRIENRIKKKHFLCVDWIELYGPKANHLMMHGNWINLIRFDAIYLGFYAAIKSKLKRNYKNLPWMLHNNDAHRIYWMEFIRFEIIFDDYTHHVYT